jgi:hypothetical protein
MRHQAPQRLGRRPLPHLHITIAKHTDTVRNVLRSTQLLDTIQSAHAYNRDSTEKPEPINMGPNFFLDAGGHSENENNDLNDDKSEDTDTSNSNSSEGDENSGRSGEDSDPPYPSDDDNDDSQ